MKLTSLKEATKTVLDVTKPFGTEETSLDSSMGRVLSKDIIADRDYPPFNRAAMDGIAIHSDDLKKHTSFDIKESVFAGAYAQEVLTSGECYKIMTGAPVPPSADTIIRIEDITIEEGKASLITDKIKKQQNIAFQGEDAKRGSVLLPKGHQIAACDITTMASAGYAYLSVAKKPNITIITTGDEIKDITEEITNFQIRDSNSHALKAFLKNYGIENVRHYNVKDEQTTLAKAIEEGLSSDILILTGGVSMGEADFIPNLLVNSGVEKKFHKVAIKPGKPIWFGTSKDKVVFGLPGNPLSCQVNFLLFIEPYLRACFGMQQKTPFHLPISNSKSKKNKLNVLYPARYKQQEDGLGIEAIAFNGSGDIRATKESNGLILHTEEKETLVEGTLVPFYPW